MKSSRRIYVRSTFSAFYGCVEELPCSRHFSLQMLRGAKQMVKRNCAAYVKNAKETATRSICRVLRPTIPIFYGVRTNCLFNNRVRPLEIEDGFFVFQLFCSIFIFSYIFPTYTDNFVRIIVSCDWKIFEIFHSRIAMQRLRNAWLFAHRSETQVSRSKRLEVCARWKQS